MQAFRNRHDSAVRNGNLRSATVTVEQVLAGIAGDLLGQQLVKQEYVFIGFIAFSTVALLFIVTEELLTEANEVPVMTVVT